MSYQELDFSIKFFRPPQRTVSFHNGLLNTRTKHTVAQDRFLVAEQRALDVERRKSASQLQLLASEQKQAEKKLSSLQNLDRCLHKRHRSISEVNLHNTHVLNESLEVTYTKLRASLSHSNQNLLTLPNSNNFQRSLSATSANHVLTSDSESGEEDNSKSMKNNPIQLPLVAIIPPEDDDDD